MAAQMNLGNSLIHVFISQNNWHQGCLSRHSVQRNNLKYRKLVKNFFDYNKNTNAPTYILLFNICWIESISISFLWSLARIR